MKSVKQTFQIISYLQYPFMILGLLFTFKMLYEVKYLGLKELFYPNLNTALVFLGVGVSFASLQDVTKTQNNFSKKIWKSKRKGKLVLLSLTLFIFLLFVFGGIGYFGSENKVLNELSIGMIVFGIGLMGMLKGAIEMYEYNQLT
ncbi:hypothetical protein [Myroides odoratus]|uniref:hypothetical protein n=1 Tax=Myroides odoratus TaxID=256 RepID=UPI0039B05288